MTVLDDGRNFIIEVGGLYAFWKYDTFPFFVGGPVTRLRGDGFVETSNYGAGSWFRPLLIVPRQVGEFLREMLREAEVEYNKAKTAVDGEHYQKLRTRFFPEFFRD